MQLSTAILSFLASVALRSLVLFAVAALALVRVKSAAGRHAVWTVVLLGMLLLPVIEPALPPLPIRVLKPVPAAAMSLPELPPVAASAPAPAPRLAPRPQYTWRDVAAALYALVALILLARLAVSYFFTRRLLGSALHVEADLYESTWISVPMTAGRKILLPTDWRAWDAAKLDAVLAHERTHVRRADWAIALAAGVARSIYWFHPLAWWLERRLASLAEHACDDAALLEVPPAPYAQALLDMASAVKTAQGRLMWEAMAMAKAAEVQKRIERALDESREIPKPFTSRRWMALAACAVPVLWLAAVAQLAPATAQEQAKPAAAPAGDTAAAERAVAANPNDLDERVRLILSYYANNLRQPRLAQIYWLIANHPEASQTLFASRGITARDSVFNVQADFDRAAGLWRQAVAAHSGDQRVVRNTVEFFTNARQYPEAEQVLQDAKRLHPELSLDSQLGRLYANSILEATGDPKFPYSNPTFAAHAQSELEASTNLSLVGSAATILASVALRPQPGETLPKDVLNLDDHPLLVPAVEFGNRQMARMGMRMKVIGGGVVGGVPGGVAEGTRGGVLGGIIGSVPSNGQLPSPPPLDATQVNAQRMVGMARKGVSPSVDDVPPAPPVVRRIEATYPPLAIQARISGVVTTKVTIATDGSVRRIEVAKGHPLLVPAALEALKEWKFQPPAVEGDYRVDIPFTLADLSPAAIAAAGTLPADHQGKKVSDGQPKTIVVGANVQAAKLVNHIDPVYPPEARAAGIQGTVTLKVIIDENGTIVRMEPADGNPILAPAALAAVRQWTYSPTRLNGEPVKVITTVVVPFTLQ
jgi:TonB family protein